MECNEGANNTGSVNTGNSLFTDLSSLTDLTRSVCIRSKHPRNSASGFLMKVVYRKSCEGIACSFFHNFGGMRTACANDPAINGHFNLLHEKNGKELRSDAKAEKNLRRAFSVNSVRAP